MCVGYIADTHDNKRTFTENIYMIIQIYKVGERCTNIEVVVGQNFFYLFSSYRKRSRLEFV